MNLMDIENQLSFLVQEAFPCIERQNTFQTRPLEYLAEEFHGMSDHQIAHKMATDLISEIRGSKAMSGIEAVAGVYPKVIRKSDGHFKTYARIFAQRPKDA